MDKISDIYNFLEDIAPFECQLSFDNAGFLIGDEAKNVKKCVVALDVTRRVIDYAKEIGAELIISHHPIIFAPLKYIYKGSLPYLLIESGISVISAHTNYDVAFGGVNDIIAEALGLENIRGIAPEGDIYGARMGELKEPMSTDEFTDLLKSTFDLPTIKCVLPKDKVKYIAVCGGAGADFADDALTDGADALVTADIKHNVFLECFEKGLDLFECGHFNTEDIAIYSLKDRLAEKFTNIEFYDYHGSDIEYK